MDIILCVAQKECLISKKTIQYIRKNIEANKIYILTSKENFKFYSCKFTVRHQIELIDENTIVPNAQKLKQIMKSHFTCKYRFGWYYQQFLKMNFAFSEYAKDYYLIWDSDTIPLNKLSFFKNDKMVFTPKTEYHKSYFSTIKNLLGYEKSVPYSFIAEQMIVDVKIMKELINAIDSSKFKGDAWYEKVIHATPMTNPNGFSEFETYGTYCHIHYKDRYILKDRRTFREAGEKYSRLISSKQLAKLSHKYDTISLESWSIPKRIFPRTLNYIARKYTSLRNLMP